MKKKTVLFRTLAGTLLLLTGSACQHTSPSPENGQKKNVPSPLSAEKILPGPAGEKKEVSPAKDPVSAGEKIYIAALKEKKKDRRLLLFRNARTLLEKEASARDRKALQAHFLLGRMAENGHGMSPDDILCARHYRIAADGGLKKAKFALAEFWLKRQMLLEDACKQVTTVPGYEKDPYALFLLGLIRYAQVRYEEGFSCFQKYLALARPSPENIHRIKKILLSSYEMYFKVRNYDGAMKELQKIHTLDQTDFMLYFHMGLTESRRKTFAGAEAYFNQSLALNPIFPFTYRELAYLYVKLQRNEEALDNIKIAYAVSGKNGSILSSVIDICSMTGNYRTLLRLISGYKTTRKETAFELQRLRGTVYLFLRDFPAAYREFSELMKIPGKESSTDMQENMAIAASYVGKLSVAIDMYEKILKKSFQVVPAMNLAELYIVSGSAAKALPLLENEAFRNRGSLTEKCIVPYLQGSALLVCGREKEANSRIREFEKMLPLYKKANKKDWDVHLFRDWLKKDKSLPEKVRKEILRMTDLLAGPGSVSSGTAGKEKPVKK